MASIEYYPDGYIEELNGDDGPKKFRAVKHTEWQKSHCDNCDCNGYGNSYCSETRVDHPTSFGGTSGCGYHCACEDGPNGATYLKEVPYSTPASVDVPMPGDMVRIVNDKNTDGDLVGFLAIISEKENCGYSLIFKDIGFTAWWDKEDFVVVENGPMHSYKWYENERIMPKK
jgi:hypothetical protein